jgi:hypothetical protein
MSTNPSSRSLVSAKQMKQAFKDEKLDELEEKGRLLYQRNEAFQDIGNVMEHPLLHDFFKKYFIDYDTGDAMLMMMKTYEQISETFEEQLTPPQKLAMLHELVRDTRTRGIIRDKMVGWKKGQEEVEGVEYIEEIEEIESPKNAIKYSCITSPTYFD